MAIKILHILGSLNRGGVESWLIKSLQKIERNQFALDFLVHSTSHGAYEDEAKALGANIYVCPFPKNPLQFCVGLERILRKQGPYNVVHSHVHYYSGIVLLTAKNVGIPKRIAHSHSDTRSLSYAASLSRRIYLKLMRYLINRNATEGLAASQEAASALWGERWMDDGRWRILHCGIDIRDYMMRPAKDDVRRELGLNPEDIIFGHVGNFVPAKNHEFLLGILKEAIVINPNVKLLLVGDGSRRVCIEREAYSLGLTKNIVVLGSRNDVPRILMGAIDVLLLPSLYEGLPLIILEAQAAGVPILMSDKVTKEVIVSKSLVNILSISEHPGAWASMALRRVSDSKWTSEGLLAISRSDFNLDTSLSALLEIYQGAASLS